MRKIATSTADPRRRGFSLLELVLALAIFAILFAMAAPRYAHAVARHRAQLAARRVAADLALARTRARNSGADQRVTFDTDADSYRIPGVEDLKDPASDYAVNLSGRPYHTSLVTANFGGDASVVFDGYGTPDSGGSVTLQIGTVLKTVVLDGESGRATVQ